MNTERTIEDIVHDIKVRDKKQNKLLIPIVLLIIVSSIGSLLSLIYYLNKQIDTQKISLKKIDEKYGVLTKSIKEISEDLSNLNSSKIDDVNFELSKLDAKTKEQINLLWVSAYKKNKDVIDAVIKKSEIDNAEHLNKINDLISENTEHASSTTTIFDSIKANVMDLQNEISRVEALSKQKVDLVDFLKEKENIVEINNKLESIKSDFSAVNEKINVLGSKSSEANATEATISNK